MEWNPKWLHFLSLRKMTPAQADKLPRPERISLNAEFMCSTMGSNSEPRVSG